jgi:hypothetical protein
LILGFSGLEKSFREARYLDISEAFAHSPGKAQMALARRLQNNLVPTWHPPGTITSRTCGMILVKILLDEIEKLKKGGFIGCRG